jgi:hypothetical protein
MVVVNRFGVAATAKIAALVYLVVGFVEAVVVVLFSGILSSFYRVPYSFMRSTPWSLVTTPIFGLIIGLVCVAIGTWLYNVLASKYGGVKISLVRDQLKSVDPLSAGKMVAMISAIIAFVIGICIGVPIAVLGGGLGILAGIAIIIAYPIFAAIGSFIGVAITAIVYNFVAKRIGGVMLYFKKDELGKVGPLSYAKIDAVFCAIIGLIYGLIFTLIFSILNRIGPTATGMTIPSFLLTIGPYSIILFPIGFAILGFVYAGFEALVYNWLAERVGGAKLFLSKK